MIDATYPTLTKRPKTFNGICVAIPAYINLFRVVDPLVFVSGLAQKAIGSPFVRVDRGRWQYALKDVWHERSTLRVLDGSNKHLSATLNHSKNWLIVRVRSRSAFSATSAATSAATDVRFIHFNGSRTVKGFYILSHEIVSDFLRDAVRGLIGNAKFALQLLRGDATSSACHQVHCVEPKVKRRRGLVEDSPSSRGKVLSASLTRPSLTLLRVLVTFELALRFTLRASRVDTIFRVPIAPEKFKASVVIGELAHELHKGVFGIGRSSPFRLFSVYWWHSEAMLPYSTYSVKG